MATTAERRPAASALATAAAPLDLVGRSGRSARETANWTRRQQILTNLRAIRGRAYPRYTGLFREKSWVFFEILLPFLSTSAFVFVYRAMHAPEAYVGFVVVGGAMTAFWINVIWSMANQLYWEKAQGNLELYFAAPMHFMSILFGMALGGMVMSSTRALAILVISTTLYSVHFAVEQWALVLVVFGTTLVALYGIGMVLASLFLVWGREAWHMGQLLTEPVYFVSGLNFPVARLGLLGALSVGFIPLATGLDAMRQLVFSGTPMPIGTPPPGIELAILVVLAIAGMGIARYMLAAMERKARVQGALTVRWQ
jgi:ABC-2 type transport system permease protein